MNQNLITHKLCALRFVQVAQIENQSKHIFKQLF